MFGCFRFALALLVVQGHLWPELAHWTGTYAVHSFYLLSGYLMALVLDRTYPATRSGLGSFLFNRVLRIYPPYLVVLLATLLVMALNPDLLTGLNRIAFGIPETIDGWVRNFTIFGLNVHLAGQNAFTPRFVPPSWSLDTELCFYLLMGLGLGRGPRNALLWLAASLGYVVYAVAVDASWGARFLPLPAASLPFSLGAVLYHWRDRLPHLGLVHVVIALSLFAANLRFAVWTATTANYLYLPFYLSILSSTYVTAALARVDSSRAPALLRRIDETLGDLSYPVFLCHWLAAAFVVMFGVGGLTKLGPALFVAAAVTATGLAWCIHQAVERPIEGLRSRTRQKARSEARASAAR